jgi:hypothetical protein
VTRERIEEEVRKKRETLEQGQQDEAMANVVKEVRQREIAGGEGSGVRERQKS